MKTSFCTSLILLAFVCLVQADAKVKESAPSNGLTTLKDSILEAARSATVLNAFKPADSKSSTEVTTKASASSEATTKSAEEAVSTEAVPAANEEKAKVDDGSKSRRKRNTDHQGARRRDGIKRLFSGFSKSFRRHHTDHGSSAYHKQ